MRRRKQQHPGRNFRAVVAHESDLDPSGSDGDGDSDVVRQPPWFPGTNLFVPETDDDDADTVDAAAYSTDEGEFVTPSCSPPHSPAKEPAAAEPAKEPAAAEPAAAEPAAAEASVPLLSEECEDCSHPAGYAGTVRLLDPYKRAIYELGWPLQECDDRRGMVQHLLGMSELVTRPGPQAVFRAARREFVWRDAHAVPHAAIVSYLEMVSGPGSGSGSGARCVLPSKAGMRWMSIPVDPGDAPTWLHVAGRALLYGKGPEIADLVSRVQWRRSHAIFQPLQSDDGNRARVEAAMLKRDEACRGIRATYREAKAFEATATEDAERLGNMARSEARGAGPRIVAQLRAARAALAEARRAFDAALPLECMVCQQPAARRCSACRMAPYCSDTCARIGWRLNAHRASCRLADLIATAPTRA